MPKKKRTNPNQNKKNKRQNSSNWEDEFWSDENFAFIAGYTSGGAPYGIPWGELDEELDDDKEGTFKEEAARLFKDSDLPF